MAGDTSGATTGKATDGERLGATPSESSTRSGATFDNGATGRPTEPFHPPPPRGHPERIALRYRIERPLDGGQGGFGTVYAAFDELTRTPVVVKLLPVLSDRQLGDIRREVVSLRQARLPGLVHMLDEGVEGRHGFIVMERVAGLPFPGWEIDPLFEFEGIEPGTGGLETLADRWERLRPIALGLLEALARLHAVGLVHRDLKPANVLVDAHGVVTLLDLGLACAPDIHPEINGGTAHYAAPEQFDPFGVPSTATDLYAVGIMIYEVLTGEVPHAVGEGGWREMARRRLEVPITLPAGLPPDLAATLGALLSTRARERPADAITTITALGGHPGRLLPELDLPGVSPPAALEALFHGPEHFLHLPSDAARELWHRTAGRAELVRRELAAWIRAGLTHKDGDRLRIRRDAIDRLVDGLRVDLTPLSDPVLGGEAAATLWRLRLAWPDTWPEAVGVSAAARAELVDAGLVWDLPDGRLGLSPVVVSLDEHARRFHRALAERLGHRDARIRQRLAAGAHPAELIEDLEALVTDSAPARAWPLVQTALARAQMDTDPTARRLLELLVTLALALEAAEPLEHALVAIHRAGLTDDPLETLVRAARATRGGEAALVPRLLVGLPTFIDEALEQWRWAIELEYAHRQGIAAVHTLLEHLLPWAWAGPTSRRARHQSWLGNLRYRQSRFTEAADCHKAAMVGARGMALLAAQQNRASALLEDLQLAAATEAAEASIVGARALDLPSFEAFGRFLQRSSALRRGMPLHPEPELVRSAMAIRPIWGALFAILEASVAWRGGALSLAADLAGQAARLFAQERYGVQATLARALTAAAGGQLTEAERLDMCALADQIMQEKATDLPPGIAVQVLGLLAASGLGSWPIPPHLLASRRPEEHATPLEVLSYSEACAHAGVGMASTVP